MQVKLLFSLGIFFVTVNAFGFNLQVHHYQDQYMPLRETEGLALGQGLKVHAIESNKLLKNYSLTNEVCLEDMESKDQPHSYFFFGKPDSGLVMLEEFLTTNRDPFRVDSFLRTRGLFFSDILHERIGMKEVATSALSSRIAQSPACDAANFFVQKIKKGRLIVYFYRARFHSNDQRHAFKQRFPANFDSYFKGEEMDAYLNKEDIDLEVHFLTIANKQAVKKPPQYTPSLTLAQFDQQLRDYAQDIWAAEGGDTVIGFTATSK